MPAPVLATKLYVPPPRAIIVLRPRLIEQLREGLSGKLTLISAPAGFGKTTLLSEFATQLQEPEAVEFLSRTMGLNLSAEDVITLEERTAEGYRAMDERRAIKALLRP